MICITNWYFHLSTIKYLSQLSKYKSSYFGKGNILTVGRNCLNWCTNGKTKGQPGSAKNERSITVTISNPASVNLERERFNKYKVIITFA